MEGTGEGDPGDHPMRCGGSFGIEAVKAKVEAAMEAARRGGE